MIVMWDVDGVLANFRVGWARLTYKRYGIELPLNETTWDGLYGPMTEKQVDDTWNYIREDGDFWYMLPPLITRQEQNRIRDLSRKHTMYYVTSRPGRSAKAQSERWLSTYVGVDLQTPTTIISSRKADSANALAADYVIDDKPGNAMAVYYNSPPTRRVYLRDQPYNQFSFDLMGRGLRRVKTVAEFLDDIEGGR